MNEDLPNVVNIGEPSEAHGLRIFPLFPTGPAPFRVLPLAGAIDQGLVEVSELSADQVQESRPWYRGLWVKNLGAVPVLLREADILLGGRQDRVVDRPAIVPAQTGVAIEVSCVEQERCQYTDRSGLRVAEAGADPALRQSRMPRVDVASPSQEDTWTQVADRRRRRGLGRGTGSLSEVHERAAADAALLLRAFPVPYGATGLVVARRTERGPRVVLVEWFCDPDALRLSWDRIIRSLTSISTQGGRHPKISRTEVRKYLVRLARSPRPVRPDQGLGAVVSVAGGGLVGAGLAWQDARVHLVAAA